MSEFSLSQYGIEVPTILRNPTSPRLYEEAIRREADCALTDRGALVAYSGKKTGRSPTDKRIVRQPDSENEVWWGGINISMDERSFGINRERAIDFLNTRDLLYCIDAYAGWDESHRVKVRVICARAYHALFMHNMLIRPSQEELENFGEPDCVVFNAGSFPANRQTEGMTSKTSIDLNLATGDIIILGTEYAGEMKKGVFTLMNYLMPKQGHLSMHCSATEDAQTGKSTVLFGLSGTGKTTLSADPNRLLIGDDEHVWTDTGVFNVEGGCYAKASNLTRETEPQIFDALRFGAVLENIRYNTTTRSVDFTDHSITQNTRGSYPIDFIDNAKIPCITGNPTNVIFLTCDAFGVLPPVSKLSPEQAEYHFVSGYTAKIAGTEMGVSEPQATFSPCFGGPFLVWKPGKYAELLSEKIKQNDAHVWLVNTGWTGGGDGVGNRISLKHTRAIIDAIHSGELSNAPTEEDPVFGLQTISKCSNVPDEILIPRNSWA
ncbi:MAG: phosphoenolpyruvate carboxykinase (ATP), partial [bacterium]|nr:phosphoenolpyruvate carboxykinase (ATP) [bacterium]